MHTASGIHKQKAARPVGIFGFASVKAALTEQCRLLIARNTADRNIRTEQIQSTV